MPHTVLVTQGEGRHVLYLITAPTKNWVWPHEEGDLRFTTVESRFLLLISSINGSLNNCICSHFNSVWFSLCSAVQTKSLYSFKTLSHDDDYWHSSCYSNRKAGKQIIQRIRDSSRYEKEKQPWINLKHDNLLSQRYIWKVDTAWQNWIIWSQGRVFLLSAVLKIYEFADTSQQPWRLRKDANWKDETWLVGQFKLE